MEVETGESVNAIEARAEWGVYSKLKVPLHLYVPPVCVDAVKRICAEYQIVVSELWTYTTSFDQVRFTMVHRVAGRAGREGAGEGRQARAEARSQGRRRRRRPRGAETGAETAAAAKPKPAPAKKAAPAKAKPKAKAKPAAKKAKPAPKAKPKKGAKKRR